MIVDGSINTVTRIAALVQQTGGVNGNFQMAILQPLSISQAQVIAVTTTATSVTQGLNILPLTASVTLFADTLYYLAVYNQVNASLIGGIAAGNGTGTPINFRAQIWRGLSWDLL